jgi:hypothetical protein
MTEVDARARTRYTGGKPKEATSMRIVGTLLIGLLAAGLGAAPASQEPVQNVILISWDGLDRSVVTELLGAGRLPNLAALIGEGSSQEIQVTGHVTVTKPGHAEMLTGLPASATGVFSNSRFRPIPEGLTIFERVQQHLGGPEAIHTFMITGKIAHVGGRGPEELRAATRPRAGRSAAPPGADDTVSNQRGEPFYLTRRHLDLFDAQQRDAGETGPLALAALERFKSPRFLAFLHFSDPDHAGHAHGIDSPEYRQAAVLCDEWLGRIRSWVASEGLSASTLIYVTTDHGFDPHGRSHSDAPHSWLATNDKSVTRGGIIADIPATILDHFGVDVAALQPPLIGVPLSRPAPPRDMSHPVTARPARQRAAAGSAEAGARRPTPVRRFLQSDADHDGRITRDEYAAARATHPRWPTLDQADGDGDGVITRREFQSAMRNQSR